ncbi:MAG: hypothetical protein ACT4NV_13750 [Rhodoferax sp.]
MRLHRLRVQVEQLLSIGDFGTANDPTIGAPPPGAGPAGAALRPNYPARVLHAYSRRRVGS